MILSPTQAPAQTFIQHFSEGWNFTAILAHGICDGFVTMSSGYNEWPKTYVWVGEGTNSVKGYLDDLENYGQAGVVYSVACSQGALDYDQPPINAQNPCVGEYLINLENRGAAAFIGYSRYGWVASSYKLDRGFRGLRLSDRQSYRTGQYLQQVEAYRSARLKLRSEFVWRSITAALDQSNPFRFRRLIRKLSNWAIMLSISQSLRTARRFPRLW